MSGREISSYLLTLLIIVCIFCLSCEKPPTQSKTQSAGNAYDLVKLLHNADLKTQLDKFPELLNYEEYRSPKSAKQLLFMEILTMIKTSLVESIFMMIRGEREEALQLLASNYYLECLLSRDRLTSSWLCGIAFGSITLKGIEIYALNCCETSEDFEHLLKILEKLESGMEKPGFWRSINTVKDLTYSFLLIKDVKIIKLMYNQVQAKIHLIQMAAAAKCRFIESGNFPQCEEDFAPFFANGLPIDPFSSKPLKFITDSDSIICYSIGPDEIDDKAKILYKAENFGVYPGDIIIKVTREREFPFPRDGMIALSPEEFRKQFPNGLPHDPFTGYIKAPLGITNSSPVYVYSCGPDTDQEDIEAIGDSYIPSVHYDPTNGTHSSGDLFMIVPGQESEIK